MVTICSFLPDERGLLCLERLQGMVQVLHQSNLIGGANELLLVAENGYLVRLYVDYTDVVFKFECFGLMAEPLMSSPWQDAEKVGLFGNWQRIECLFRFEWERPALSGEVPPHWDQVVRHRGKRSDIPNVATAIGVSMVGLLFWDVEQGVPVASFVIDDEEPATLRLVDANGDLGGLLSECERVFIDDVSQWNALLGDWVRCTIGK